MPKGNDGRARRRILLQKVSYVVASCAAIIVVVEVCRWRGGRWRRGGRARWANAAAGGGKEIDGIMDVRKAASAARRRAVLGDGRNPEIVSIDNTAKIDLILSATVHLISIDVTAESPEDPNDPETYRGVMGEFCVLDWSLHKTDPSSVPMFRDLVTKSKHCSNNSFKVDLKAVTALARERDEEARREDGDDAVPRAMYPPSGFIFHESRCGSTLVGNVMAAMDPDAHRVYSESHPPMLALRSCGDDGEDCSGSYDPAAALLRDVAYMMGRTNDPMEKRVFFKVQSLGTRSVKVFRRAFPDVPWLFVYRDPVQVMMSHLDHPNMAKANCVRPRMNPPKCVSDLVSAEGMSVGQLSHEEYCAAHLLPSLRSTENALISGCFVENFMCSAVRKATICNAALTELESSQTGRAVNYNDLLDDLMTRVIPHHFQVPIGDTERARIIAISGKYSKGRGETRDWEEDSEAKEERATDAIKKASEEFLEYFYERLENLESQEY